MIDLETQLRAYASVLDRVDPAGPVVTPVEDAPLRHARRWFVVAIAAVVIVAISVAVVSAVGGHPRTQRPNIVSPSPTPTSSPGAAGVLAVGDSVMLGARASLRSAIPGIVVDAGLTRQMTDAVALISADVATARIGTIVVGLGTNAATTAAQLDAVMRAADGRAVFFITVRVPRAWEKPDNQLLRDVPNRWRNAHVIDWQAFADSHDDWFLRDGFHVSAAGQRQYSALIAGELGPLPLSPITGATSSIAP